MGKGIKFNLGKRIKLFANINRIGIPYCGIKHRSRKGHTQSLTVSPLRKTVYTKTKIKKFNLKTKTNLDSFNPKIKISKNKKRHY